MDKETESRIPRWGRYFYDKAIVNVLVLRNRGMAWGQREYC